MRTKLIFTLKICKYVLRTKHLKLSSDQEACTRSLGSAKPIRERKSRSKASSDEDSKPCNSKTEDKEWQTRTTRQQEHAVRTKHLKLNFEQQTCPRTLGSTKPIRHYTERSISEELPRANKTSMRAKLISSLKICKNVVRAKHLKPNVDQQTCPQTFLYSKPIRERRSRSQASMFEFPRQARNTNWRWHAN